MDLWIPVTIFAAFAQNLRFMLQRHLKATRLSTGGATFARFVYSAPAVAVIALAYGSARDFAAPGVDGDFWAYATLGGLAQILATMCTVALFAHRNFAVGITFKKTEVLMAAIVGLAVLGEGVSGWGLVAILIGLAGVLALSERPGGGLVVRNRATGLGLLSGFLFAVSGVAYRGATLALDGGDAFFRAVVTLSFVTAFQTIVMLIWLRWREPGEITRVIRAWRIASLVGLTSMLGSIGWFFAFALQTVAYVKALGQIELVFSYLASTKVFREVVSTRELAGIGLIVVSVMVLVLTV